MLRSFSLSVFAFATALCIPVSAAWAQERDEPSPGYTAIIDNIDLLVDNYTRFLARKYDLTEEQDEYTKYLLRERAYTFLEQHEPKLRQLVDRMFDVRTGGDISQDELIEWGKEVRPIYEDAKRLIIDGNTEWREILTDEQRKVHDEDLRLMYQSFETTEDQLDRIVAGEMTVDEFRSPKRAARRSSRRSVGRTERPDRTPPSRMTPPPPPPPPPPPGEAGELQRAAGEAGQPRVTPRNAGKTARRPSRLGPGRRGSDSVRPGPASAKPADTAEAAEKRTESEWEKYVREFIEKYHLNDEQTQKAHSVLEDCQGQADRYLAGRKTQMERLDSQIEELKSSKDQNKRKELPALQEQRKKLMEPIDRIFNDQLKPRLERLPTRAQRRAAEEAASKKSAPGRSSSDSKKDSSKDKD